MNLLRKLYKDVEKMERVGLMPKDKRRYAVMKPIMTALEIIESYLPFAEIEDDEFFCLTENDKMKIEILKDAITEINDVSASGIEV